MKKAFGNVAAAAAAVVMSLLRLLLCKLLLQRGSGFQLGRVGDHNLSLVGEMCSRLARGHVSAACTQGVRKVVLQFSAFARWRVLK